MTTRSLTFQRSCIEHLVALHSKDVENTIIEGAKQAALTIGWIERQAEILRMLDTLRKERPDLFAIMSECASYFPGTKIADVPVKQSTAMAAVKSAMDDMTSAFGTEWDDDGD